MYGYDVTSLHSAVGTVEMPRKWSHLNTSVTLQITQCVAAIGICFGNGTLDSDYTHSYSGVGAYWIYFESTKVLERVFNIHLIVRPFCSLSIQAVLKA